mgnify:CR=1 FL=1|jgi:hypothetical protein
MILSSLALSARAVDRKNMYLVKRSYINDYKKERGRLAPCLLFHVKQLRSLRTKHAAWVTEAERVSLSSFVSHVSCVEVTFHRS